MTVGRLHGAAGRWSPDEMDPDWIPIRPRLVCEVAYDTLDGRRMRYPARFARWRPDREARSCRFARLTTVAPYSLRANTRPTASVPLTWSEVEAAVATGNAGMLVFEAADVIARLAIPTPGVASGFASTPPCRDRRL